MKEAQSINKSLSTLGAVMKMLVDGREHVRGLITTQFKGTYKFGVAMTSFGYPKACPV